MEAHKQDYENYLQSRPQSRSFIRALGPWRVETATEGDTFLLLLVNVAERAVLKFVYEGLFERSRDVEMLKRIPHEAEAGAGIAVTPPGKWG